MEPEPALSLRGAFEELQSMDAAAAESLWLRCVEGWTIEEASRRQQYVHFGFRSGVVPPHVAH